MDRASIHALIERRLLIIKERERLDAEIKSIDSKIESYRAIERARWAGVRVSSKTESKALHWGFILNSLEANGPMSTAALSKLASIYIGSDNYNTMRSHLHRMALGGLIEQDREKCWKLTERASVSFVAGE